METEKKVKPLTAHERKKIANRERAQAMLKALDNRAEYIKKHGIKNVNLAA